MDEKTVQQLMNELIVTPEQVYEVIESNVDIVTMMKKAKEGGLTFQELAMAFAYHGFMQGVEFALRNLESTEEPDQGGGAQNG